MSLLRIGIVAAALIALVVPLPAEMVERWYSKRAYLHFQRAATGASNLVPVALFDVAALLLLLAGILFVARRWRRDGARPALIAALGALILASAIIYLWFFLFWGLNYRRVPLEKKLAYDAGAISRESALRFGTLAVDQVNALAAAGPHQPDVAALARAFDDVQRLLGAAVTARPAAPKASLLDWYFRKSAIDGMTDPFFLEVLVHSDVLPTEYPFLLAHEWAHLAGYADESEASFVAWLTCLRAGPAAAYSGWLRSYEFMARVLPREDRRALRDRLAPAVVRDLQQIAERYERASPAVQRAARGVYDQYLRANRIEEGIANYALVTRLMLGARFDDGWVPRLAN